MVSNRTLASVLLISILISTYFYINKQQLNEPNQRFANFNVDQVNFIKQTIYKAASTYSYSYQFMALYIENQLKKSLPGYWIISVYHKQDYHNLFYYTGQYDFVSNNKMYYQVTDYDYSGLSFLILQVNNVRINSLSSQQLVNPNDPSLQFTRNKSDATTPATVAKIDLALTATYAADKNIIDFTNQLSKNIIHNLGPHWDVCTRYQKLTSNNFAWRYTSPYNQWLQYDNYGVGSTYILHIYTWQSGG